MAFSFKGIRENKNNRNSRMYLLLALSLGIEIYPQGHDLIFYFLKSLIGAWGEMTLTTRKSHDDIVSARKAALADVLAWEIGK